MKRGPRIDLGGMPAVEGLPEEDQIERLGGQEGQVGCHVTESRAEVSGRR